MNTLILTVKTITINMINFIAHVGQKIGEMLQYPIAWISGLLVFIGEALAGGKFICYIVIIASVLDLICGIATALRRGKFTQSELMRQTVEKLVVYGAAILIFLCIDKYIQSETSLHINITAGLVGIVITMTETWSLLAALLILFPDNAFLKFMQKYLVGELARKLGCEENEVSDILNAYRQKRADRRLNKNKSKKKETKTK